MKMSMAMITVVRKKEEFNHYCNLASQRKSITIQCYFRHSAIIHDELQLLFPVFIK